MLCTVEARALPTESIERRCLFPRLGRWGREGRYGDGGGGWKEKDTVYVHPERSSAVAAVTFFLVSFRRVQHRGGKDDHYKVLQFILVM